VASDHHASFARGAAAILTLRAGIGIRQRAIVGDRTHRNIGSEYPRITIDESCASRAVTIARTTLRICATVGTTQPRLVLSDTSQTASTIVGHAARIAGVPRACPFTSSLDVVRARHPPDATRKLDIGIPIGSAVDGAAIASVHCKTGVGEVVASSSVRVWQTPAIW